LLLQFVGKQVLGYIQNILKPGLLPFIYSFIALVMGDVEKKKSPSLLLYLQLIHTSQSRPIQSACIHIEAYIECCCCPFCHTSSSLYTQTYCIHMTVKMFLLTYFRITSTYTITLRIQQPVV
jgi:hypothetical protein